MQLIFNGRKNGKEEKALVLGGTAMKLYNIKA
jgi:hypothetical protein